MCWPCKAVYYVLVGIFFFFWDSFKAFISIFIRGRSKVDFGDEICLVTGAAQGLGRELALELAARGGVLVLWDIQGDKLQQVADEIEQLGNKAYPYVCNCSSREDIYRVAARVRAEVGDVSVIINNAGVFYGGNIQESKDRHVEDTFQINTLAHFWVVKAFLPWMIKENYGYIVQIASITGYMGIPKLSDYCASKAASISFSESLRSELRAERKTGITVTCVCPFMMDTTMFTGAKTSLPSLFPPLRTTYVIERILQAIEEKQFIVMMPRMMYLLVFLKSVLPTRSMDAVSDLIGSDKALDGISRKTD